MSSFFVFAGDSINSRDSDINECTCFVQLIYQSNWDACAVLDHIYTSHAHLHVICTLLCSACHTLTTGSRLVFSNCVPLQATISGYNNPGTVFLPSENVLNSTALSRPHATSNLLQILLVTVSMWRLSMKPSLSQSTATLSQWVAS